MPLTRRALAPALLAAALACAFASNRALASFFISPKPQSLLTLYKHSARVVVASVGVSEVLATEHGQQLVRTTLHVKEDVKGSGDRVVNFYHSEPVREESGGPPLIYLTASWRVRPEYKQGKRFLFFLERREAAEGFEVNDEDYGVKALSDDDLKVYLERMKELAVITRQETENKAALVEWLVRCVEEPATRWEGAYELQQSAEVVKLESDRAAAAADKDAEAAEADDAEAAEEEEAVDEESAEESGEEEEEDASPAATPAASPSPGPTPLWRRPALRFAPADSSLAPLLDAGQKRRLADALYAAPEMGQGENALLQLVKGFGDAGFTPFIITQLRRVEDNPPYEAGAWLHALASSLGNRELSRLAEGYTRSLVDHAMSFEAPADAGEADVAEPKLPESEEEHTERLRDAFERAQQKRSAALKAALSQFEQFLATGALASK